MNDDRAKFEALTDEQIIAIKKSTKCSDPYKPWGDTLAFARSILASAQAASAEPVAAVTDEPEAIRMAYKTGYDEGFEDGSGGAADHDACEEGWQQYLAALATRTPEPHGRTVYQLPKGEQIAANAALSGQFKQASAPGYFVQQRSTVAHRTPEPQAEPAALATDDVIAAMLRWYERNTGNAAIQVRLEEAERLLASCGLAMRLANGPTDWRHMIAAIDAHLGGKP